MCFNFSCDLPKIKQRMNKEPYCTWCTKVLISHLPLHIVSVTKQVFVFGDDTSLKKFDNEMCSSPVNLQQWIILEQNFHVIFFCVRLYTRLIYWSSGVLECDSPCVQSISSSQNTYDHFSVSVLIGIDRWRNHPNHPFINNTMKVKADDLLKTVSFDTKHIHTP